jgi:uncharacterized Fe-S cluster-containing radical SAM superfamily protein
MRNNHMEKQQQQQQRNYSKRNVEAAKYKEGRIRTNKKHSGITGTCDSNSVRLLCKNCHKYTQTRHHVK